MLTKLTVRNFKRFDNVGVELGSPVVFIGPNNSGKTTALQALALWEIGVRRWFERRGEKSAPEKRPGVTINRRDLIAVPVPDANQLWHDLRVRSIRREGGAQSTQNIRIDIMVEGVSEGVEWRCGLEFDYANEESFYCRPLRLTEGNDPQRMEVPKQAGGVRMAFLPPMSGLAAQEVSLDPGAVNVRIGEGRTAEVLRNLCYQLIKPVNGRPDQAGPTNGPDRWKRLVGQIRSLFGVTLNVPEYITERGEIVMSYREPSGVTLDLSSAGRGLQQTLLLLAYMYANPGAVLLLDEPDAHLEILRQRQIYQLITDVAREQHNQVIAATHSEVVLNEAAGRDVVVAFVGRPHRLNDDRGSQVLKALKSIGFDQYYQAEQSNWVLYLEGSTDLAILKAFAETLGHGATSCLERPFVVYVGNTEGKATEHFFGLVEAVPRLKGVALFDRLDMPLPSREGLVQMTWSRREIENYLCYPEVLVAYARGERPHLPGEQRHLNEAIMERCIHDLIPPLALRDRTHAWWVNTKVSDEFLDPLFELYFRSLRLPNAMRKSDYHELARLVCRDLIVPEVSEKLDAILRVAQKASESRVAP